MKVKSSQDRSGHDRSSQVRTSLVREGYGTQERTQHFLNQNYFGPKIIFWTPKNLWTQNVFVTPNILDPKIFRTQDFKDQQFYRLKKISDPKLKTFTSELSVALLSPTCYLKFLRRICN